MSDDIIVCEQLRKRFGPVAALDGLDVRAQAGCVVGFLGPNGSGKSTTIRILLDLARADSGSVRVLGEDPRFGGPELRRRIGYLPGEMRLDDRLRVDETLRAWARIRGNVDPGDATRLCDRLGLDPSRHTRTLSTGNRRKVGLVGAFMGRPELLVLDEPTAGVDPLVQVEILDLITESRADGASVFLSSHVLSDVQRVADEVVVIRAGRTVATGDVDSLRRTARQEFRAWFDRPAPEDALRSVVTVSGLVVRDNEAHGVIEGDPAALLAVLAAHGITHLVMPEPDLEQAFLAFYEAASNE